MFGNPQDILAILAGAALIFGAGGSAVARKVRPGQQQSTPPEGSPPEISDPAAATEKSQMNEHSDSPR
jgi:hypothetical protein